MPLALTRRGWAFTLAALGVWASWFAIGLRDLWYLAALLAAMVALALLWLLLLPLFARFRVTVGVADPTPTLGERSSCTATVAHRLPAKLPLQLEWRLSDERLLTDAIASRNAAAVCRASWVPPARGPQRARVSSILVLDPLGLAQRRLRITASAEVLVLPAQLPELARDLDGFSRPLARSGAADGRMHGQDSGPPSGSVRGYRNGDALRQIHWKQSARQGELLVNLHDGDEDPGRSLQLLTATALYRSRAEFEAAVAAAATLAVHWLRQGHPVRLSLGDDPTTLCRGESEALRRLALVTASDAPLDLEALPQRFDAADAVILGEAGERLRRVLGSVSGGLLLSTRAPSGPSPRGWRAIAVPQLRLHPFPAPTTAVSGHA